MTHAILLDENFPLDVARGLAATGHDVLSVALVAPGISDRAVLALARSTGRWLLTFDADFGDLIFHQGEPPPPALLYFRLHPIIVAEVLERALRSLVDVQDDCFAVVTRDSVRMRRFASASPMADG
ncbi:MAG TPA: DUF5615 family PIN-like protein [Albitalea sp.]|nr:DUF5615 family PIN-like protein [Albitalea sp.]